MSCQNCGSKTARLRQGDLIPCNRCFDKRFSQQHSKKPNVFECSICKKSFETLRGRNLHLAKSKECERGSENERPADAGSTSTVTDNNLHSSNTSRLSVVKKKGTQQELVFIRIPVQMNLEQDLRITKVRMINVYQDNYHSITESVNQTS